MADIFMRFPGGKAKALTLSYDDGVRQDIRLIEIMKAHGLKGTFNLNSGLYSPEGTDGKTSRRMTRQKVLETYTHSGIEVAVHSATHPHLNELPVNLCTYEVLLDRMRLEKEFKTIIRGMAYPFGTYNDEVVSSLKQCGIVYARTTKTTEKFDLPTDWLRLQTTCHHNNPRLMDLAKTFVEQPYKRSPKLFYLWGHSYEFDDNDNWHVIEQFAQYIGGREDIWYATNIEIYDYVTAYSHLVFSMDQKQVYNPTGLELHFHTQGDDYSVKPGSWLELP